jgi:hypothetical protein
MAIIPPPAYINIALCVRAQSCLRCVVFASGAAGATTTTTSASAAAPMATREQRTHELGVRQISDEHVLLLRQQLFSF